MDRYLVWLMPLLALYVAEGVAWLKLRFGVAVCRAVGVCLLIFAVGSSLVLACVFHAACQHNFTVQLFVAECECLLPKGASVGTLSESGIAYGLSDRKLKNLSGVYSPEFRQHHVVSMYEVLKNEGSSRFDYWFVHVNTLPGVSQENQKLILGEIVHSGPDGIELRRANWQLYDNSVANLCAVPTDKQLVSHVDVGEDRSEEDANYEIIDRYGRDAPSPYLEVVDEGSNSVFEVSRVVLGGTRMSVPLKAGKDAILVLRTKRSVSGDVSKYQFSDVMRFNLEIDGNVVGVRELPLQEKGFTDGVVLIPGELIKNSRTRVGILGDHLSCRYRFYQ